MWVSRREWEGLNRRYREMIQLYWQESASNTSLKIDVENLERKVKQLEERVVYVDLSRERVS